jgi:hypothetical protein
MADPSFQTNAPNWEAFKQSDEYAKSATQMGSAVIAPLDVGGTTYNFSNPVIADAYKAYMSRMGVDVKSGGSPSFTIGALPNDPNKITGGTGMGASLGDPQDYLRKTANTEDVLKSEYQKAVEEAKKQRAAGFMGRVVLPGEMGYESFAELNQYTRYGNPGDMVDIVTEMEKAAAGNTTGMPTVTPTFVAETPGTVMTGDGTQLGAAPTAGTTTADTSGLTTTAPTGVAPGVGQISGIQDVTTGVQALGPMTGATLTPTGPYVDMTGVQAGPSAGAIATAATDQLDPRATTQYQLGQLMSSLQSGAPMPPWAAPAVRKIGSVMQARGLGSSSMAGAAMTQALMESGVAIAQQDANKYATIQLANLNNKQQTALANAATFAAMDKANLNARMTAAVTNAQSLLSVDLKNLDNEQKASTLTYNALVQGLFKDAAEENARRQFNAKNELQVEEFFAELGAQVDTANANRVAAMRQFNTSETNAMSQFNANLKDSRQKFNASMRFAVDQSNVVWRREINTANTAIQNETNRMNVQNQYNMTMTAMNNLWQEYRDDAAWNFQKSESALARQHDLARIAFNYANAEKLYDQEQQDKLLEKVGEWLQKL